MNHWDFQMSELTIPCVDEIVRRFTNFKEIAFKLRAQSSKVLLALMRSPGETVSKEQLLQQVWSGRAVTDDSLVQCIKEIRYTLGDSNHQVLQTVHRRGYRLMLDRTVSGEDKVLPWLAVLPCCLDSTEHSALTAASRLLCDLNAKLVGHSDFSVLSRFTMNSFRDQHLSVRQMSDRFGAQYLLSGELGLTAGTFNWFFELINARSDRVLWLKNGTFTEADSTEEMACLVGEIADQIILALLNDWCSAVRLTRV
jgi:TolB-like protein